MTFDLERIAGQSRLHIPPEERPRIAAELDALCQLLEQLPEAPACDCPPEAPDAPLRADEVQGSIDREALLQNAPRVRQGCFEVPKTVDTEETGG